MTKTKTEHVHKLDPCPFHLTFNDLTFNVDLFQKTLHIYIYTYI